MAQRLFGINKIDQKIEIVQTKDCRDITIHDVGTYNKIKRIEVELGRTTHDGKHDFLRGDIHLEKIDGSWWVRKRIFNDPKDPYGSQYNFDKEFNKPNEAKKYAVEELVKYYDKIVVKLKELYEENGIDWITTEYQKWI